MGVFYWDSSVVVKHYRVPFSKYGIFTVSHSMVPETSGRRGMSTGEGVCWEFRY